MIYRDTFFNYTPAADKNESSTKGIELIYIKEINPGHPVSLHEIDSKERFVWAISFFAVFTGLAACQSQGSLRELANRLYIHIYSFYIARIVQLGI